MPGGLRAKSVIFAFPFYDRQHTEDGVEEARAEAVIRVFTRLDFVKKVWVNTEKLRDPLYIEVNPQSPKLQDKNIAEIEAGLEKLLAKVYNFRECL